MRPTTRSRLRAGDPDAFRDLFREHAAVVHRFAIRLGGDVAVAEDVVQLTFLEAWRTRDRLRDGPDDGPLRPWLLGIATNVLRNTARAARRHRAAMARLPVPDPVGDIAEDVVDRSAQEAELAAVRAALHRLRRSEREVIALCVWSGLDYAAAATALGVPVGTVRSRLSRARTKLRRPADESVAREREPRPPGGQHPVGRHPVVRSGRSEQEGC